MSATPENLESYLSGRWQRGEDVETRLVDPVRGEELATVSAKGLDLKGALAFARKEGQDGLRSLGYGERAKLLGAVADVLVANRARYEEIAIANSGNTKIDAAIDIDGGIGTLKYYARLGAGLGEGCMLLDEKPVRLAKAENYQAVHLLVPRRGAAVHINAFNFPSWGLWEKAAVSAEPVKATTSSEPSAARRSPAPPQIRLSAPSGNTFAATTSLTIACASSAVADAGFASTGTPATSATAAFSHSPQLGKLKALMWTAAPRRGSKRWTA